ncbi:MAG: hypothetical protein WCK32_03530 [Chlorobiaceae bacterium]
MSKVIDLLLLILDKLSTAYENGNTSIISILMPEIKKASDMIKAAKDEGRDLTDDELNQLKADHLSALDELDKEIAKE